jgi:hypothetical protein
MQQPEQLSFDWTGWVAASSTHNYSEQDLLVDF